MVPSYATFWSVKDGWTTGLAGVFLFPSPTPFIGPRVAAISFLVMTAAFGLNFAAGQFFAPLGREEGWGVAEFIAAAMFGAASFPVIPLVTGSISQRFGTRAIGAVLGTTFVVHQLGAGVGVLAAGLVRDSAGTYDPALFAAAGALLVGAALVARVSADPVATSRRAAALDRPPAPRPTPSTLKEELHEHHLDHH